MPTILRLLYRNSRGRWD